MERIIYHLEASSALKWHMFLQRGGILPKDTRWHFDNDYEEYAPVPHFILMEEEEEIKNIVMTCPATRDGIIRRERQKILQGAQGQKDEYITYVSNSESQLLRFWITELYKRGIVYPELTLMKQYMEVMDRKSKDPDMIDLEKLRMEL